MTDNELKAAAVGIITYASMIQTDDVPEISPEGWIESGAFLDNVTFDKALELCSLIDIDNIELYEEEDEDDDW